MEKIGFYLRTTKTKNIKVNYRLRVGRDVQMFHRSDIKADLADLNKLEPNGAAKPRISIYNESLAKQLKEEYDIMCSAYDYMCENGINFVRFRNITIFVTEYRPCPITDWGVPGWKRVI